ncbi:MAG: hypothetical protein ACXABD_22885, partial [Candidatus Thorarchaeota archaeon]
MTSLYMQQNPDANRSETKEYFESEYDRVGKPKFQKPERGKQQVTESVEEVKVEDSKSTNPSFEKGSMRNFSVDGGVLEIGRVNNASLSSILRLEVEKDSRRQGKAEVLLKRALNETKGELSGQASNDAAVALNYKLGMRVKGNETLSLKEAKSERSQSGHETISMALPESKRGGNYKPFKQETKTNKKPKFQKPDKYDKKTLKTYMAKEYAAAIDMGMTQDDAMF